VKHAGRWIAALGVVVAVALFVSEGLAPIAGLLASAGAGLLIAALFHIVPMTFNAIAWRLLLQAPGRGGLACVGLALWIRESVNGLLPVARIGGEIASYRLLVRRGLARPDVAASVVVDMAVALASQGLFCLLGVALLVGTRLNVQGTTSLLAQLIGGCVVLLLLPAVFVVLQRTRVIARLMQKAEHLFADRWSGAIERSARVDQAIRDLCARRHILAACCAWQMAGWVAGAGEIWLALYFLGQPASVIDALLIEAIVQMISSVAFVVPGAIGVQEAGFLAIGAALGIDGPAALALSASRRIRDLVIFFPGLLAWQWSETRQATPARR
jgi:putative membrane protein